MYDLLAQAVEAPLPAWGQLGIAGIMLGLFAWLITKGAPAALDRITDISDKFIAALNSLTDKFNAAQEATREDFSEALKDTQARCERQVERCLTHCEQEQKNYREGMHTVRNIAAQKPIDPAR